MWVVSLQSWGICDTWAVEWVYQLQIDCFINFAWLNKVTVDALPLGYDNTKPFKSEMFL